MCIGKIEENLVVSHTKSPYYTSDHHNQRYLCCQQANVPAGKAKTLLIIKQVDGSYFIRHHHFYYMREKSVHT
jgi:hypothetical protein